MPRGTTGLLTRQQITTAYNKARHGERAGMTDMQDKLARMVAAGKGEKPVTTPLSLEDRQTIRKQKEKPFGSRLRSYITGTVVFGLFTPLSAWLVTFEITSKWGLIPLGNLGSFAVFGGLAASNPLGWAFLVLTSYKVLVSIVEKFIELHRERKDKDQYTKLLVSGAGKPDPQELLRMLQIKPKKQPTEDDALWKWDFWEKIEKSGWVTKPRASRWAKAGISFLQGMLRTLQYMAAGKYSPLRYIIWGGVKALQWLVPVPWWDWVRTHVFRGKPSEVFFQAEYKRVKVSLSDDQEPTVVDLAWNGWESFFTPLDAVLESSHDKARVFLKAFAIVYPHLKPAKAGESESEAALLFRLVFEAPNGLYMRDPDCKKQAKKLREAFLFQLEEDEFKKAFLSFGAKNFTEIGLEHQQHKGGKETADQKILSFMAGFAQLSEGRPLSHLELEKIKGGTSDPSEALEWDLLVQSPTQNLWKRVCAKINQGKEKTGTEDPDSELWSTLVNIAHGPHGDGAFVFQDPAVFRKLLLFGLGKSDRQIASYEEVIPLAISEQLRFLLHFPAAQLSLEVQNAATQSLGVLRKLKSLSTQDRQAREKTRRQNAEVNKFDFLNLNIKKFFLNQVSGEEGLPEEIRKDSQSLWAQLSGWVEDPNTLVQLLQYKYIFDEAGALQRVLKAYCGLQEDFEDMDSFQQWCADFYKSLKGCLPLEREKRVPFSAEQAALIKALKKHPQAWPKTEAKQLEQKQLEQKQNEAVVLHHPTGVHCSSTNPEAPDPNAAASMPPEEEEETHLSRRHPEKICNRPISRL